MKNLGTIDSVATCETFLSTHKITTGEFDDIEIGDYVTIQDGTYNKEWWVAGLDWKYNAYYGVGDKHHICLLGPLRDSSPKSPSVFPDQPDTAWLPKA